MRNSALRVAATFAVAAHGVAAEVDYLRGVKPLLAQRCSRCHGASQQKGGLRLDTATAALRGGDSGPAFKPGHSEESLMVRAVKGTHPDLPRMPYKKPPLDDAQIALIAGWIDQGGRAPSDEQPEKSGHWAFAAPVRPDLPAVRRADWARNPIDRFILARLEKEGLTPSPEADRVTLIRRLSLDLLGLPPRPEEVDSFVHDRRPDAWERLVDRCLASPHYGERWGRWWLDGARYADSNGYSIDAPRSIWKYRDWVIEAFNRDLPFDTFAVWQLAGDLLPGATPEQKIATGFHRNTQINQEGGIDPEQFRVESVMDRVNTTATVFLGVTLACAQCHDHKFDPFTQREYYQMFAFFNSSEQDGHGKGDFGPVLEFKESPGITTTLVMQELPEPRETHVFIKGDFTRPGERVDPGVPAVLPPLVSNPRPGRPFNRLDLARWIVAADNPLTARVIVNRVWQQYFGRGIVETENDFGTQGSLPSHPELLDWLACEFSRPSAAGEPLNRPKAETGDAATTPPFDSSTPRCWSLKHLHRLIVSSAAYRQSSKARPELRDVDPNNRLLARQTRLRLDAEIVRDVCLAASGLLSPKMGGPPVNPPQPDGVMTLGQSKHAWKSSPGEDHFRRGVYTQYYRATPHPALNVFDAPDGFSACTRRLRSNTPLQALTLLNDEQFYEFARALGGRVLRDGPASEADRIDYTFRLCLSRRPTHDEAERLRQLTAAELGELEGGGVAKEAEAWTSVARVLLNLDEMITRE